jgi:hypothetical protein
VEVTIVYTGGLFASAIRNDVRETINEVVRNIPGPGNIGQILAGARVPVDLERYFPSQTVPLSLTAPTPGGERTQTNPFPNMPAAMTQVDMAGKKFANGSEVSPARLGPVVAAALLSPCTIPRRAPVTPGYLSRSFLAEGMAELPPRNQQDTTQP